MIKAPFFTIVVYALFLCSISRAETTPMSQPLVEESETLISCEYAKVPSRTDIPVLESAQDAEKAKGSFNYKLWLPKGYLASTTKQWPCMFIMSPGGKAGMGKMANYLKSKGFVVVMLVEAKNGPWGPIIGNFLAAHDDVIKRVRIKEGQKFATGFSGGARGSSVFVQARPGFCGLILQGAGTAFDDKGNYLVSKLKQNTGLYTVMLMGDTDKNNNEVGKMKAVTVPGRFHEIQFTGGHAWAPADTFEKGMAWLSERTMKK